MKYATFNADGALTGFYDDAIHELMPEGAVEITDAQWTGHLDGQGRLTLADSRPSLSPIPAPSMERLIDRALRDWGAEVGRTRAAIAGTADPVKLAEYADKAAHAQEILDGTASPALTAEAEAEAARLGLAGAGEIGALWIEMAEGLRAARTRLNVLEPSHGSAIAAATDAAAVDAALSAGRAALVQLTQDFAPEETGNA